MLCIGLLNESSFSLLFVVVQHNPDHTSTVASKRPSVIVMSSSATVPEPTVSVGITGTSHVLSSVFVDVVFCLLSML